MNNQQQDTKQKIPFRDIMPIATHCARLEEALISVMDSDTTTMEFAHALATLYRVMDERPSIGNSHE